MIHSIAHAESYAIDLIWDVIVRFVKVGLPLEFYQDWARIANEEAAHFKSWADRLKDEDYDAYYGGMIAHDGLWDTA